MSGSPRCTSWPCSIVDRGDNAGHLRGDGIGINGRHRADGFQITANAAELGGGRGDGNGSRHGVPPGGGLNRTAAAASPNRPEQRSKQQKNEDPYPPAPLPGRVGDALFRQLVVRRNVGLVGSCSRLVLHQGTNGIGRSLGIVNRPESIYLGVQKLGFGMP